MKFEAKKNELSKHFISLKDGEEVIGVFQGEPHVHYNHWDNAAKRSTVCPGDDCELCLGGDKKKFRARLNMVVKGPEGLEAKVLECGWKLYNTLSEINADFPLEKGYTKVRRSGKTMHDTVYTALPSTKLQLTDDARKAIEKTELLPLDPADPFWSKAQGASDFAKEEEVPF